MLLFRSPRSPCLTAWISGAFVCTAQGPFEGPDRNPGDLELAQRSLTFWQKLLWFLAAIRAWALLLGQGLVGGFMQRRWQTQMPQ